MRVILTIFLSSLIMLSCNSQDCNKLPYSFTSYSQAISLVKNSTFKIEEVVNTSTSTWIKSAKYYSCDGAMGYFIYKAKGREYIHQGVPINIWREFKNSSSRGSYYDGNIRYKYKLNLQ
jgi:hypothetical protein